MGSRAYMFPNEVGMGKFEILGKYARSASLPEGQTGIDTPYSQKTTEINFNYVIKQFNARVMFFFKNTQLYRSEVRLLAGRSRPADPDVTPRSLNLKIEGD